MFTIKEPFQKEERFGAKHYRAICSRVEQETGVRLHSRAPRARTLRWVVATAAVCVCLFVATPALAAGIPGAYEALYAISPETAQFFKPVQKSAEYQGIEVKVVSAYVQKADAEVLITVHDTESDRLDQSIDLYDSYDINTAFDSIGTCSQVGYDGESNTATFLITINSMNADESVVAGEKVTFTVTTLLGGKTEVLDVPIDLDWNAIPETVETEKADPYENDVLTIGEEQTTAYEGFAVTGIGYVDGKLHIQLYTPGRKLYDDHAFLYLMNANGEKIDADMLYRGGYNTGDSNDEMRADYVEYVFDVPQSELQTYTLYGDFYSAKTRIDGNWSVTFPLENQD